MRIQINAFRLVSDIAARNVEKIRHLFDAQIVIGVKSRHALGQAHNIAMQARTGHQRQVSRIIYIRRDFIGEEAVSVERFNHFFRARPVIPGDVVL